MFESLSMEWSRRLRGLTMLVFNFGVQSLEQSVELDRLVILISLAIPLSKHLFFQTDNQKAVHFTVRQGMQFQENPVLPVAVTSHPMCKLWSYMYLMTQACPTTGQCMRP